MSQPGPTSPLMQLAHPLLDSYVAEISSVPYWHKIRPADYPAGRAVLAAEPGLQLAFVEVALARAADLRATNRDEYHSLARRLRSLLLALARRPLPYESLDAVRALDLLARNVHSRMPVDALLLGLATVLAERGLSQGEAEGLRALREAPHHGHGEPLPSDRRLIATATRLLEGSLLERPALERHDDWGSAARRSLDVMSEPERELWLEVLRHAETLRSDPPSDAWLARARERVVALGDDRFRARAMEWLGLLDLPPSHGVHRDPSGRTVASGLIAKTNGAILRGLAWCCTRAADDRLALAIARAAESSHVRVEGWGPRSAAVVQTCLSVLAAWPMPAGSQQLGRLSGRVPAASALLLARQEAGQP